jgi:AcrR family transcriptional regulator
MRAQGPEGTADPSRNSRTAATTPTVDQSGRVVGPRGLRTRLALLDALAELLRERGAREIRVADITNRVGTSPATFYQYFQDVPEATLRLGERALEEMPGLIEKMNGSWEGAAGLDTARALVSAFVLHWDQHRAVLRLRDLASEEGDRRFQRLRRLSLQPVVERLARLIDEARSTGRVAPEINSRAAAAALAAILERLAAHRVELEPIGVSREELIETSARIVHQIVTGQRAS